MLQRAGGTSSSTLKASLSSAWYSSFLPRTPSPVGGRHLKSSSVSCAVPNSLCRMPVRQVMHERACPVVCSTSCSSTAACCSSYSPTKPWLQATAS